MTTDKIAVAQCRTSKGNEYSILSQQSEILTLAEKLGIKEEQIDWFIEDEARSLSQDHENCTLFENKVEEVCNNSSIAYFLSYSQEKFCRNSRLSMQYKDKLAKAGIKVRFVIGDIENERKILSKDGN